MGAFGEIYDRYSDRLFSYSMTMLRNRDDAADATHDAFVKAATRLKQIKDPSKLRPWLFSIVRNECHSKGRDRVRLTPTEDLSEAIVEEPDLAMGVKQEELRELVWAAAAGLGDRDRELLGFHLVEGLEGEELAEAMGVTTAHVHVLVSRMKVRVQKALGALLIARLGSDGCDDLAEVLRGWDGDFDLAVRSRVTRHIESCDICIERRAVLLAPANVLPAVMIVPAPEDLRSLVLEDSAKVLAVKSSGGWKVVVGGAVAAGIVAIVGLMAISQSNEMIQGALPVVPALGTTTTMVPATTSTIPATTSTSTTTTGAIPTTTALPPPPPPGVISVSGHSIDFGSIDVARQFEVTNTGGLPADWIASSTMLGVSLGLDAGTLDPGESVVVPLALDRNALPEGDTIGQLLVQSEENVQVAALRATQENNPIILPPLISPASFFERGGTACLPNTGFILVDVRDESPIESVIAIYKPDGASDVLVSLIPIAGDTYEGAFGGYTVSGLVSVRIVATDVRGNAGGTTIDVNIIPCP